MIELVFKEWLKSLRDLEDNELFPNACEHLDDGYHDLWDAWFSEEEGKEGYKALSSKCDKQHESIRKQIESKIKSEIAVKFSYDFKSDQLNMLVNDIYDYIEHKVESGRDLFSFEVETKENQQPSIVSVRKEGVENYYRHFHYLETSASNLEKIAEILNSMLSDTKFNDDMEDLRLKKADKDKKLEQFKVGLNSIINTSRYELFEGIEGKCRRCKDWKP